MCLLAASPSAPTSATHLVDLKGIDPKEPDQTAGEIEGIAVNNARFADYLIGNGLGNWHHGDRQPKGQADGPRYHPFPIVSHRLGTITAGGNRK